jgi:hypothetical protein
LTCTADADDLEGGGDLDDQAELEELRSVQLTRTDLEAMYDKPPFDSECFGSQCICTSCAAI